MYLSKLFSIFVGFCVCVHSSIALSNDFSASFQNEIDRASIIPQVIISEYEPFTSDNNESSPFSSFELHYLLGSAYLNVFMADKSLEHLLLAKQHVSQINEPWRYYSLLTRLATAYELAGDAKIAMIHANKAYEWAKENNQFDLQQSANIAKGVAELTLGEYDNALLSFQHAYKIAVNNDVSVHADNVAYYIALSHEYMLDDKNAINYFMQSAVYFKEAERMLEYSDALFGTARAHKNLDQLDLALNIFTQSIQISEDLDDSQGQAYTLAELADIYLKQGKVKLAHNSLVKALKLFVGVYRQLAQIALNNNSIDHAITLSNIALPITNEESMQTQYASLLDLQAELFSAKGDFEKAYTLQKLAKENRAAYNKRKDSERYTQLQADFELTKTIDENTLLAEENASVNAELSANKQQSYLLFVIVFLLLALTIGSLYMYLQSRRLQKELATLANTDSLTSLANRRTAFTTLVTQLKLAKREKFDLSVALVDLDYFKQINDQYGHAAGDKILQAFSDLAINTFRSSDLVARIGGEEFLFIFPFTSVEQAQSLIIEFTEDLAYHESVTMVIGAKLTCSVGITDATQCDSEHDVLNVADKAMYRAKELGRDAIVIN